MALREWLTLLVTVLVGLGGLFYASTPEAGANYGIGLAVFGLAIVYGFTLLKRYFDSVDSGTH